MASDKGKLIIIDDDFYFRIMLESLLVKCPIQVESRKAFSKSCEFTLFGGADAAILDFHLAPDNAIKCTEDLQRFYPMLPVVIVSSDTEALNSIPLHLKRVIGKVTKGCGPVNLTNEILKSLSQFVPRFRGLKV